MHSRGDIGQLALTVTTSTPTIAFILNVYNQSMNYQDNCIIYNGKTSSLWQTVILFGPTRVHVKSIVQRGKTLWGIMHCSVLT